MSAEHDHLLREHAVSIWQAGVDAVRSEELVQGAIHLADGQLNICGHCFELSQLGKIAVVGAGKAGAGMAVAVEAALGDEIVNQKVEGWVNVPADCIRPSKRIHLHAGRPAGVNEPTNEGADGSAKILKIVSGLTDRDLCLVLISGGGSALLPAPKTPLTLEHKQMTTRFLMQSGATIQELNAVRKRLSRIKGGGLARASRAGRLISLIISDIVGDPLDMIASGPTVLDPTTNEQALAVLTKYGAAPPEVPQEVIDFLQDAVARAEPEPAFPDNVDNHIIGNNKTAVEAAAECARQLGYEVRSLGSDNCGEANEEGRKLAKLCHNLREDPQVNRPVCVLSGGEPVVHLPNTNQPRMGGRNQELVLAGLAELKDEGLNRVVILSGGTDGEDGPTDAAGAWVDDEILAKVIKENIDMDQYLAINDSWTFFDRVGGLLNTGPTHTNVMDLRVAVIGNEI